MLSVKSPILRTTITEKRLTKRGYESLAIYYQKVKVWSDEPPSTRPAWPALTKEGPGGVRGAPWAYGSRPSTRLLHIFIFLLFRFSFNYLKLKIFNLVRNVYFFLELDTSSWFNKLINSNFFAKCRFLCLASICVFTNGSYKGLLKTQLVEKTEYLLLYDRGKQS